MMQYNTLNGKLSKPQLTKIKLGIKNWYSITQFSSNATGESKDETNFPYKLLSTNTQVSRICKAFVNGLSSNITFLKTHLSKAVQLEEFPSRFLGPLVKTGLLLIGNVLEPLAKTISVPLGLTATASARDAAI